MTNVERYARCETPKPFWTSSLESRLEIERLTSGLEGAVGKVLNGVTRWQPTLPHDAFLGGGAAVMSPCCPTLIPTPNASHWSHITPVNMLYPVSPGY
jgi:hypothetical protein